MIFVLFGCAIWDNIGQIIGFEVCMMQYYFEVSKIIDGALTGGFEQVAKYSKRLADKLKEDGDVQASAGILKKLSGNVANVTPQKTGRIIRADRVEGSQYSRPIPAEKDSHFPLADKSFYERGAVNIYISSELERRVQTFIKGIEKKEQLINMGLPLNASLLMYGVPGTGKTKMAAYLASQLGLPLVTARSDALISSYLGATAKNIRRLLEYAKREPCVLFLDEFDAIAKARDDKNELGELKRVVVSLLQNIDALEDTILIAATNHPQLLDPAIWRRFHNKLELKAPDEDVRQQMLKNLLGVVNISSKELIQLVQFSEGLTGAEIEMSVHASLRETVLNEEAFHYLKVVRQFLMHKYDWMNFASIEERNHAMIKLRNLNDGLYTHSVLAGIFEMSRSNVQKILKGGNYGQK